MHTHTQCLLRRGTSHQMAWIPTKFASQGKHVRIGEQDGWLVMSAALDVQLDSAWVRDRGRDHLKMRSVTDI